MKYRFALRRLANALILSVAKWDEHDCFAKEQQLISLQIVEDFTTDEYFMRHVRGLFADAKVSASEGTVVFKWSFSEAVRDRIIFRINLLASPYRYGPVAENYTDLIGKTPLLKLNRLAADCEATVLVKLESMEPNSVKDRPIHSIVSAAMERKEIGDDTEVVEASSGNVAFALSAILRAMAGKKPRIFISKMHGHAKIRAVRVSGCPVVLTSAEEGTLSAKKASIAYAKARQNVFEVNQHSNPDNPKAHRLTTGPELYHQCHLLTGQPPAEFVTGLGSGGTAAGVALFREDIGGAFKVIGVEPAEASLWTGGPFRPHRFSGLASGFKTGIITRNRDRIDHIETITWQEGFDVCRRILVDEGLLLGASSGASIGVALRRARLPENRGKVIVTIAHDRGERYLEIPDLFVPPPQATEEDAECI